jgi:tetratricopeptide (TPR) repeat protein
MGLSNLAELCQEQGRYAEAEALHRRALAIREKAMGKEHPAAGFSLHRLALLHEAQGRLAEAKQFCQRALFILREKLPAGHPAADEVQKDCGRIKTEHGEPVAARAKDLP